MRRTQRTQPGAVVELNSELLPHVTLSNDDQGYFASATAHDHVFGSALFVDVPPPRTHRHAAEPRFVEELGPE